MKEYQRKLIKNSTILLAMVVFSLAFLPAVLVKFYPTGSAPKEPDPAVQEFQKGSFSIAAVKVYRHQSGKTETLDFEEYVKGVVAGEMPATFEEEALKAQAVAARTYAASKIMRSGDGGNPAQHPDAPLCDDVHCQVYRSVPELSKLKSEEWMKKDWLRIVAAVEETEGQVMYYDGALVQQPLFHSSSGGRTENSEDVFVSAVPYLRSVDSTEFEAEAPHQGEAISMSLSEFTKKIKAASSGKDVGAVKKNTIQILTRSEGNRVEEMQVGNLKLEGRKIRDICGLRSANFTVAVDSKDITFTTTGYGHGVGMSQWGANGMAKKGNDYQSILKHYYSGVTVE